MMIDNSRPLRRALVKLAKNDAGVTSIVAQRTHAEPPDNPVWPFAFVTVTNAAPYSQSCGKGSIVSFEIHTFANGPGTDNIENLNAAFVEALTDVTLDLDNDLWDFRITGSRYFRNTPETSAYHGVISGFSGVI